MIQTGLLPSAHSDLVTDAAYDHYGLRLATCSLDQRIKIWQLDESTGQWSIEDDWKAHDAAICKVAWAFPEHGSILASCSFDRTVKVWEQQTARSLFVSGGSPSNHSDGTWSSRWAEIACLTDAKGSVRTIEFAPAHFGLKLASLSTDNVLRLYECIESPKGPTWELREELDMLSLPTASPSTAAIALANATAATLEGAAATLAAASSSSTLPVTTSTGGAGSGSGAATPAPPASSLAAPKPGAGNREADGGWSISWCKEKYWGQLVAVASGVSGSLRIIQFPSAQRPVPILTLDSPPISNAHSSQSSHAASSIPDPVVTPSSQQPHSITSVSWAPSIGRSYHLIATGGRDGRVRIWKVKPPPLDELAPDEDEKWGHVVVGEFDDHKSSVSRVEWNVTGTVLSSSANDGRVRLWKATFGNVWRSMGYVTTEVADEEMQDAVEEDTEA